MALLIRICIGFNIIFYIFQDTHALVRFLEEDSTAIVPVNRIKDKEEFEYGGSCAVLWSNKKVYKAFLICSGMYLHI